MAVPATKGDDKSAWCRPGYQIIPLAPGVVA
jgi:hypothetical protein